MNKKIKLFLIICLTSVFLISGSLVSFASAPTDYIQWTSNENITFGAETNQANPTMWYDMTSGVYDFISDTFWTDEFEREFNFYYSDRFKFKYFLEGPGEEVEVSSYYFGYNYDELNNVGNFYVYGGYTLNGVSSNVYATLFSVDIAQRIVYFPSVSDNVFDPAISLFFDIIGNDPLVFNYSDKLTDHYELFNTFFVDRIYYKLNDDDSPVINSYTLQLFNNENTIIGNGLYDSVQLFTNNSNDVVNSYTFDDLIVGQRFYNITQIEIVNSSNNTLSLELVSNNTTNSYTILPNESSPTISLNGDTNLYLSILSDSSSYYISGLFRFKDAFLSDDMAGLFAQLNNKIDVSFTFPYTDDSIISQLVYKLVYIPPTTSNEEYVIYADPLSVSSENIALFVYDPLLNYDNRNNYYLPVSVSMNKYNIIDFGDSDISVNYTTYTILNTIGEFGDFENTNGSYIDNLGLFLLDSVNGFLSFQIVPGFSLYNLLTLVIAIPLLIYILKLFLGG